MRTFIILFGLLLSVTITNAQTDVYTVTGGELIFSGAEVDMGPPAVDPMQSVEGNPRFTFFFHAGQYIHMDFTNFFGLYSGMAIRNVGFISEDEALGVEKEKHRSYTLGIPLALKFGSFRHHLYLFGGGEYELLFHYKYKYWKDGDKFKTTEWFSDRTKRFVPSVFIGMQFPKGLNLKFKYYLDDFLNNDFKKGTDPLNDYSRYGKTQIFYISVSWQFDTREVKKVWGGESATQTYHPGI